MILYLEQQEKRCPGFTCNQHDFLVFQRLIVEEMKKKHVTVEYHSNKYRTKSEQNVFFGEVTISVFKNTALCNKFICLLHV